jgi:hypothetical protein
MMDCSFCFGADWNSQIHIQSIIKKYGFPWADFTFPVPNNNSASHHWKVIGNPHQRIHISLQNIGIFNNETQM